MRKSYNYKVIFHFFSDSVEKYCSLDPYSRSLEPDPDGNFWLDPDLIENGSKTLLCLQSILNKHFNPDPIGFELITTIQIRPKCSTKMVIKIKQLSHKHWCTKT